MVKKKRNIPLLSPLAKYVKESYQELKKVAWPKKSVVAKMTILVVVTMIICAAILGALDYGLSLLMRYIIAL